jgi:hypothetical protein
MRPALLSSDSLRDHIYPGCKRSAPHSASKVVTRDTTESIKSRGL